MNIETNIVYGMYSGLALLMDIHVPITQSEAMTEALRKAGVPVKHRRVPGGSHGPALVDDPEIAAEILAWFDKHLVCRL